MKKRRSVLAILITGAFFVLAYRSGAETICPKVRPVTVRCVRGTILDQIGGPVSHATVTILREGNVVTSVQTDEDGRFEFQGIKVGHYELRAEHRSFKADQYPIIVKSEGHCKNSIEMVLGIGFEASAQTPA